MKNKIAMKIFISDDDTFSLNIYEQYLLMLGYTDITLFESKNECIDSLSRQPYVILLDQGMDHRDGYEVLKKIKQINPDIYVIFISDPGDRETELMLLKSGAFDCIEKGPDELKSISSLLEKISDIRQYLRTHKSVHMK